MKTIIVGDTHGRDSWLKISEQPFDRFIFIGDYLDTHENITGLKQIDNLRSIIAFKQDNPDKVILLIGNHDYHYWPGVNERYSGYQSTMRATFEYEFQTYGYLFQMAHEQGGTLFTHAGVTNQWCKDNNLTDSVVPLTEQINDLFKYKPQAFGFYGFDPYGDNITQGPIWVRPRSLMRDSVEGYKQVVGHTAQNVIFPKHRNENQFWFIDTLGTSGEYLVIEDGNFKIQKHETI